eukprot:2248572-Rhodomonas_salina.1
MPRSEVKPLTSRRRPIAEVLRRSGGADMRCRGPANFAAERSKRPTPAGAWKAMAVPSAMTCPISPTLDLIIDDVGLTSLRRVAQSFKCGAQPRVGSTGFINSPSPRRILGRDFVQYQQALQFCKND